MAMARMRLVRIRQEPTTSSAAGTSTDAHPHLDTDHIERVSSSDRRGEAVFYAASPSAPKPQSRSQHQQQQQQREQHQLQEEQQDVVGRRVLRSQYLAIKNSIIGESDGLTGPDSDKFNSIIKEVESLHHRVLAPREQVADSEALLDITKSLLTSVKAQKNDGLTPSELVSYLLRDFGQQDAAITVSQDNRNSVLWKEIGHEVAHIFKDGVGCCTMLGPMNAQLKQRKPYVRRKHARPPEVALPEELHENREEKTDTDVNMSTMFTISKRHRRVRLGNLVLNRHSFAQTVENVFALSFLVKDGRAAVTLNEEGHHLVSYS